MRLNSRPLSIQLPLQGYLQNPFHQLDHDTAEPELQESTWVQLHELPSPYSYDQALLLCQHSDTEWIVWVPEHGEMLLHRSQFDQVIG